MEFRGKRGRRIPILLTAEQTDHLEVFLKFRTQAGVSDENPYVFGVQAKGCFSACKILRNVATQCGAAQPELLRGTFLRKQIATISQVMDLSENDMQLAACGSWGMTFLFINCITDNRILHYK